MLGASFKISSVRHPKDFMNVGWLGNNVWLSDTPVKGKSFEWVAYKLPDEAGDTILLGPASYSDWYLQTYEDCSGEKNECKYVTEVVSATRDSDKSVPMLALQVRKAPDGSGGVMLKGFDIDRYLLSSDYGWTVGNNRGDPGTGGYWVFDPPLPLTPPPFSGRRCNYDCSSALRRSGAVGLLIMLAAASIGTHQ
jgi:hypothetical protein